MPNALQTDHSRTGTGRHEDELFLGDSDASLDAWNLDLDSDKVATVNRLQNCNTKAQEAQYNHHCAQRDLYEAAAAAAALGLLSNQHHGSDYTTNHSVMNISKVVDPDVPTEIFESVDELKRQLLVAALEVAQKTKVEANSLLISESTLNSCKDDAAKIRKLKEAIAKLLMLVTSDTTANQGCRAKKRKAAKDDARNCPTIGPLEKGHVLLPLPQPAPDFCRGRSPKQDEVFLPPEHVLTWMAVLVKNGAADPNCENIISVRNLNAAWDEAHASSKHLHYDKRFLGADPRNNGKFTHGLRTPQCFSPFDVANAAHQQWPGIVTKDAINRLMSQKMHRAVKKVTERRTNKLAPPPPTNPAGLLVAADTTAAHTTVSAAERNAAPPPGGGGGGAGGAEAEKAEKAVAAVAPDATDAGGHAPQRRHRGAGGEPWPCFSAVSVYLSFLQALPLVLDASATAQPSGGLSHLVTNWVLNLGAIL